MPFNLSHVLTEENLITEFICAVCQQLVRVCDELNTPSRLHSQLIRPIRFQVSVACNRCDQSPSHSEIILYGRDWMSGS